MFYLIASKKSLKRAVDRNLARRRVRAALDELQPGWRKLKTLPVRKIYVKSEWLTLPFPELKGFIKTLIN